jgi:hypothetical protein
MQGAFSEGVDETRISVQSNQTKGRTVFETSPRVRACCSAPTAFVAISSQGRICSMERFRFDKFFGV